MKKQNKVGASIARPLRKNKKGITLISLVITIIVLLILAGITINLTIGENGIIKKAQEAGKNYQNAAEYEQTVLAEFTNEAESIINGIGETTTPVIDINTLQAGDYVKYDSGDNGIITCRVLYPVTSEYGLQIIANKSVKQVTLGGSTLEEAQASYNNAIKTLNDEAEAYINEKYAYDARCVGSIPTVENGMFINKNSEEEGPVTLQFTYNGSNTVDCKKTDTNYVTDEQQIKSAGFELPIDETWVASRTTTVESAASSQCGFFVRRIIWLDGTVDSGGGLFYLYNNYGGSVSCSSLTRGLRPCISLKSDVIKITGGDGKSEDTAYILGI